MNNEARSAEVYNSKAHIPLIDRYPRLGNFLLLLSLVSLFCLSVFLLSDILSIGVDAPHKGLFDGFNSGKNIAEFTEMMNQKYNDMKFLLGFKPEDGHSNTGYSNSSARKNGTLLMASGVPNDAKNGSSSLSSPPASAANISKRASSGSRYIIPASLGDDSSSDERTPPKKLGGASRKNTNQSSPGINHSRLGLSSIDDLQPVKSSDISKDNASLSNAFASSDILSDNFSAGVISTEKASFNLNVADYSAVKTLKFDLGSKDKVKGSSKIAVQTKNKINSRSKGPSKPKDGKSIQSNKRIRAVRSPKKMIPPNRPKNSKKRSK